MRRNRWRRWDALCILAGMTALWIGGALFSLALWAVSFWGSIHVLDRENAQNKFGHAMALSALHLVVALILQYMFLAGLFFAVGWLVFMWRLLLMTYRLGFLKILAVLAALGVGPYYVVPWLNQTFSDSEVIGWIVLYGFPVAVFAAWLRPDRWRRDRTEKKTATKATKVALPVARVERQSRPARPSALPPMTSVAPTTVEATPPSDAPRLLI
jgi:hypothetical protein